LKEDLAILHEEFNEGEAQRKFERLTRQRNKLKMDLEAGLILIRGPKTF
jgi:hypothetical protein